MARPKKKTELTPLPCNIFERGDGWFQAWVPVGDGVPPRKRSGKTAEIVEEKVRALLAEIADNDGEAPAAGKGYTVESFFTLWLTKIAPYGQDPMRPNTISAHMSLCKNWIFPHIGQLLLPKVRISPHLDDLYGAMYAAGIAPSSVLRCHAVIRRGLAVAVQRDLIKRNVAAQRDNPGSTKGKKRKPMSAEQAHAFVAELDRHPNGLRWKVGLAIGPRQGEALGIRWTYLDLDAGTVAVDWQLQRLRYEHGCKDPAACAAKRCRREACPPTWEHGCGDPAGCTGHGYGKREGKAKPAYCPRKRRAEKCRLHRRERCPKPCPAGCTGHAQYCDTPLGGGHVFVRPKAMHTDEQDEVTSEVVSLPPSLVGELKAHRIRQRAWAESLGDKWEEHDLVFCQRNGRPIDAGADLRELKAILVAAGLPEMGTHAAGRTTAATLLSELGIRIEDIQPVLRHGDIRVTRGYIPVGNAATKRAAAAMDKALFSTSSSTDQSTVRQDLVRRRTTRRRRAT